jgi:hypothetical protein
MVTLSKVSPHPIIEVPSGGGGVVDSLSVFFR